MAAGGLSVERALKAFLLLLSVVAFVVATAGADDAVWCSEDERTAYRGEAPSASNPTVFVLPKVPATTDALDGLVDLLVTLDASGAVTSACALRGVPEGVFEQVTVEAVRHWRYAPADVAKFSTPDRKMKVQVVFRRER